MKRFLTVFLAVSMLFSLTGCSPSRTPVEESPVTQASAPIHTTAATAPVPETSVPAEPEPETSPTEVPTEIPTEAPSEKPTEAPTVPPAQTSSELVKISRADFPIWSGPGYDYFPAGTVEVATVYTIVEKVWDSEGNLWGKLKSGAGWVDLTLNQQETNKMPPVTVSRAEQSFLNTGNYHYCEADSSEYAYEIVLRAHEGFTEVSFFSIEVSDTYKRGMEYIYIRYWDSSKPLVVSVSFPGAASLYGLEVADSQGVTHVYSIWESGRNGSVGISPCSEKLSYREQVSGTGQNTPSLPSTLRAVFSSGVGAWQTLIVLDQSGFFTGSFVDFDMGDTGEDYPNGICYLRNFSGTFHITGTEAYAVKLSLAYLRQEDEEHVDWIYDGTRYIVSSAYGLTDGTTYLLYMPDTPVNQLPSEIRQWWYDMPNSGTSGRYILYCVESGYAFLGE